MISPPAVCAGLTCVQHALYIVARPDSQFVCMCVLSGDVLWPEVQSHSDDMQSYAFNCSMFCTCTRSSSPLTVMHSSSYYASMCSLGPRPKQPQHGSHLDIDPCYPRSNPQTLLPHMRYWKWSALGLFGFLDKTKRVGADWRSHKNCSFVGTTHLSQVWGWSLVHSYRYEQGSDYIGVNWALTSHNHI